MKPKTVDPEVLALTHEQEQAICKYVEGRLGAFGLEWFGSCQLPREISRYKNNQVSYKIPIEISKQSVGIYSLCLKEFQVEINLYRDANKTIHGKVHIRYQHKDGGSNGMDLGVKFFMNVLNEVKEVYN